MAGRRGRLETAPEQARRAQRLVGVAALLAVAAGTAGAYVVTLRHEEDAARKVADALAKEAAASVETVVGESVATLQGAGALAGSDGTVDREDFQAFGRGLLDETVSAVGLGVVVPESEREEFEARDGPIRERRGNDLVPASPADPHYPIVEIASEIRVTEQVDGLDYASEPVRAAAVELARDEGRAVLSAPTRLIARDEPGFLAVRPLYRRGAPIDSVEGRRAAFVGFVTVGYDAAEVLGVLERELPPGTGLRVLDGRQRLFGTGSVDGRLGRSADVRVPGRTWTVVARPADGVSATLPRVVLFAGAATFVGLLVLLLAAGRYQSRLRRAWAAEQQAQRRSETLEGLASRLSQSLSSVEVAEALLQYLRPFTGTTAGAVLAAEDDDDHLRLLAAQGYGPDDVVALDRVHLAAPSAVADAVRSAEPVWAPSPLAWRDDPVLAAFGAPGRAVAVVPLRVDRRVLGLLVLVHAGVRRFYDDERSLLTTVSAMAAQALLRARRYDTEHDTAVVLQRALLPAALPVLPDLAVAVRYLPATGGLAVGGDFYDLFALDDGRVAVVIGDVVGRGVRAAAAMGQLRSAAVGLATVVADPAAFLRAVQRHVPAIPDALCATMIYAVVDRDAARVSFVRAGHPPPVLLRPGSGAEILQGGVSPPLGVTGGTPPAAVDVDLEPGDTLVLYTDGVVERRGEPVTAGLERLRAAASPVAGLDPEACCDRLVAALLADRPHDDDAAIVAIRFEGSRAPTDVRREAAGSAGAAGWG